MPYMLQNIQAEREAGVPLVADVTRNGDGYAVGCSARLAVHHETWTWEPRSQP